MISEIFLKTILIVSVVVLVSLTAFLEYKDFLFKTKEAALGMELRNLRVAIMVYRLSYNCYPDSTIQLPLAPHGDVNLLIEGRFDLKGEPLDPFGNPYIYDKTTGTVFSSTEGCELK
ncbi:MAG: type II secretion system protein GspG [Planctomycetota bacterium]